MPCADCGPFEIFLVDPDPSYRRGNVLTSAQSLIQIIEVFIKIFGVLLGRYLVYTSRLTLAYLAQGFLQQVQIYPVGHRGEHQDSDHSLPAF